MVLEKWQAFQDVSTGIKKLMGGAFPTIVILDEGFKIVDMEGENKSQSRYVGELFNCKNAAGENEICGKQVQCENCIIRNTATSAIKYNEIVEKLQTKKNFMLEGIPKTIWLEMKMVPFIVESGKFLGVGIKNVTKELSSKIEIEMNQMLKQKNPSRHISVVKSNKTYCLEARLNKQKQFLDDIYGASNAIMMLWHLNGAVVEVNEMFQKVFHIGVHEIVGQKWYDMIIEEKDSQTIIKLIDGIKENHYVTDFEINHTSRRGERLCIRWNHTIVQAPDSDAILVVSFGIDITNQREKEQVIDKLMYKSSLTGLNNRIVLEEDIKQLIDVNTNFTLYYIDISQFKYLNDVYGYEIGDKFLKYYAEKLKHNLKGINLYHLGQDEFCILEEGIAQMDYRLRVDEIIRISKEKWCDETLVYYPAINIGVASYPKDGGSLEEIFKNIDIALSCAKSTGKNKASKYNVDFKKDFESQIIIQNIICETLINNGFELYIQPIFNFSTKAIYGGEVLLRCNLEKEKVNTKALIDVAEETGLIKQIDRWVVKRTFQWIGLNLKKTDLMISINLSSQTVTCCDFLAFLQECLEEYQINTNKVTFELTEHSLIHNMEGSCLFMQALKDLGFCIAIDDFGTRYSSLNYLTHMPFDSLKIDKSYIDRIPEENNSRIVIQTLIQLANRLGMKTVAEGIEKNEQYQELLGYGCDFAQGYLLAKPMDQDAFLKMTF